MGSQFVFAVGAFTDEFDVHVIKILVRILRAGVFVFCLRFRFGFFSHHRAEIFVSGKPDYFCQDVDPVVDH
jgi:hypothetical protein